MARRRAGTAFFIAVLLLAGLGITASSASQKPKAARPPLSIAAASDLQSVWPAIAERFTRETGQPTRVTFGSSGNFFAQITNGAPFDVFLSADLEYPRRLVASGAAAGDTLYEYATGRIVVWARRDKGLDLSAGLRALTHPDVRRIAIANPEHAPYGRAAMEALRSEKLDGTLRGKLVFGESVAQAAQFVQSGNADAAILAASLAFSKALASIGTFTEIPATAHAPLRQAGVVLSGSRHPAARALLLFLRRPEVRALLEDSGFSRDPSIP